MATLQQITAKAKTLYKKGKAGLTWTDSIKKASAMLSGVKRKPVRKSVGAAPKPKRKRIAGVKIATSNVKPRMGAIGAVKKGEHVMKQIDTLEGKLKNTKDKTMRSFYIAAINQQHDKLDSLTKNLKK